MIKLRTILPIYKKTRFDLTEQKVKNIELPKEEYKLALIEAYNITDIVDKYKKVIKTLLKDNYFIFYVSTYLPSRPIIDENIIYIKPSPRFMGVNTFTYKSFKKFSFVFGLEKNGIIEGERIRKTYNIPLINDIKNLPQPKIIKENKKESPHILFDTNYNATGRGLGDILMSTAIIKKIKEKYPDSEITYSTRPEAKDILLNNSNIDNIKTDYFSKEKFKKELDNYDRHYFLGKLTEDYTKKRNQQPRIDSMAELFELNLINKKPEIYLTRKELQEGRQYTDDNKKTIVFCIEGIEKYRNYKVEYLKEILKRENKHDLIVVGKKRLDLPKYVKNLTNKTSVRELFKIIANADLVVTMDNFVSHIVASFDIPSLVLYTTIPSEWRSKYYTHTTSIQSPVKCSPCWNLYKVSNNKHIRKCPNEGKCIDALEPNLIVKNIDKKLKSRKSITTIFKDFIVGKPKSEAENLNKSGIIYISMWRRLGDCLFCIPTIKAIREKYPNHKIIWGTHYKYYDIVKNLPYIDNYVLFQGQVDEGWDAYLPNPENQVRKLVEKIEPEKIYNLHVSPRFSDDLSKKDLSIVEYVAYELVGLKDINTKLEYFPNKKIESKVKKDFKWIKKNHKGVVVYNGNCFSITEKGKYSDRELNKILTFFERANYKVISIGNIVEDIDISRSNYRFCSLDYMYYAIKYSDLFLGYDSGLRNLALTVPNSKIISLENEQSELNKTKVSMLSDNKNHVGIDINENDSLDIYLKGVSLINNKDITIKEYRDIRKYQFVRRKESESVKIQNMERGRDV